MPGPDPGIHVLTALRQENVDGRDKPGHDEKPMKMAKLCAGMRQIKINQNLFRP
jgi:hypothetical protein